MKEWVFYFVLNPCAPIWTNRMQKGKKKKKGIQFSMIPDKCNLSFEILLGNLCSHSRFTRCPKTLFAAPTVLPSVFTSWHQRVYKKHLFN